MDTALHFAADVQGGLLQRAEEERSPASDGFMVADANHLVTLEQAQQKRDAVDVLHSYVREYVQKKGSEVVVDSLPAMRAIVQRLKARFADRATNKGAKSCLQKLLWPELLSFTKCCGS